MDFLWIGLKFSLKFALGLLIIKIWSDGEKPGVTAETDEEVGQ